jgi:hypothetical protein
MTLICNVMIILSLFFLGCLKSPESAPPDKVHSAVSEPKKEPSVSDGSSSDSTQNVTPHSEITPAKSEGEQSTVKALQKEIKQNWLAKLETSVNRVEFRQRNESIWKPAELGMVFVRFDALQTQNQSTAKVIYQSGSGLDVKDNTLIIFDHDPGTKKKAEDRVIIKNGELVGSTKTELWIFTNAGLVQIKPEKQKTAKAKVSIAKNDKLAVKVDSGSADVVFKGKEEKYEKIRVAEKSDVEIVSSVKLLDSSSAVSAPKLEEIASASEKVTKVTRAELKVDEPVDGAITSETEITAKGSLSDIGAKLLINGQLVEFQDNLSFSKKIVLQPGSNLIVFQLVRSDASVQFMRKTVRLQANK